MSKNVKKEPKDLLKEFCLDGTILGLKYFYLYPDPISRLSVFFFVCTVSRHGYNDLRTDLRPTVVFEIDVKIIHALTNFEDFPYFLTDPLIRCFWAATIVTLLASACSVACLLYWRFDQMPTRITIENQYEPLSTLPYPAITICSPSQMTISSMDHFNRTLINGNLTIDLETVLPQLLGYYEILKDIDIEKLGHLQDLIQQNRYSVPQVLGLLPQSCEDFLKVCIFKLEPYKCSDLFRPLLTRHGLCCVFNSVYHFNSFKNEKDSNYTPQMATERGIVDALRLVVDFEPDDALSGTIVLAGAIRVMVSDWTELPSDDESVIVYPNTETFNVIHGTHTYCSEEVSNLPNWSRECLFENERRLPYFHEYRNNDCDHLCLVHEVEKRCGCLPLFVPGIRSNKACNLTNIPCIVQVKALANRDMEREECDCPRDCDSRRYALDVSVGNLLGLRHIISNPYANATFKDSTSIMTFFFLSSVYVKKKQETVMSLLNLAANLGGIFGLCLGCSVISVLEILFYAFRAARVCLASRLRRTVQPEAFHYNK